MRLHGVPIVTTILSNRRRASREKCPACRADVLYGLDNDTVAFTVIADARPLNRREELLAVIAGRHVYELDRADRLFRRDRFAITRPSARPVVADHVCPKAAPARPTTATTAPTQEELFA
jgi:hypothetical protein